MRSACTTDLYNCSFTCECTEHQKCDVIATKTHRSPPSQPQRPAISLLYTSRVCHVGAFETQGHLVSALHFRYTRDARWELEVKGGAQKVNEAEVNEVNEEVNEVNEAEANEVNEVNEVNEANEVNEINTYGGAIYNWDVSKVTKMDSLIAQKANFNTDITLSFGG